MWDSSEWKSIENRLENTGLLLGKKGEFGLSEWDTHPIIRDYFGTQFKQTEPDNFKQAHAVLFDFNLAIPEKQFPDTLSEMAPLFRAIMHGCKSEKYCESFDVYRSRVSRDHEYYSQHTLGAYSEELSSLSSFFPNGWEQKLSNDLSIEKQAWIYAETSYCLMSLGYLHEAVSPREKHLQLFESIKDWMNAARAAQNLVDLYLPLMRFREALSTARLSVEYAEKSKDTEQMIRSYGSLGMMLYHDNNICDSLTNFNNAELHTKNKGDDFLSYTYGSDYCLVLLDIAQTVQDFKSIKKRAKCGLQVSIRDNHLVCIALYSLILGKVYTSLGRVDKSNNHFNVAMTYVQKTNAIRYLPIFCLAKARFHLSTEETDLAKNNLDTAFEIIERYDMKFHAIEYLLVKSQYHILMRDYDSASSCFKEANSMICESGHQLFNSELVSIKNSLANITN